MNKIEPMIDLSHFHEFGFQILKNVFSEQEIVKIQQFLFDEKTKTLELIHNQLPYANIEDLIKKIKFYNDSDKEFDKLDPELKQMLSGHFPQKTRLSPKLLTLMHNEMVSEIYSEVFPNQTPKMHLPPTARFVLPGNNSAGVPPHQDISYNQHLDDFFVMWVPFSKIDDQCGGVKVYKDTGSLPEQLTDLSRRFWLEGVKVSSQNTLHCKMNIGDALLLNKLVVHESMPNHSERTRYSIDFRFFLSQSTKHYYDIPKRKIIPPETADI